MTVGDLPRLALVFFLSVTCVAKVWGGYAVHYAITRELFVVGIVLEGILVMGLTRERWCVLASIGVATLAAVGIVIQLVARGKTCGCLGALGRMTSGQHVLVNATMGAIAVLVWLVKRSEHSARPPR